jgi:hypothetical protein
MGSTETLCHAKAKLSKQVSRFFLMHHIQLQQLCRAGLARFYGSSYHTQT